MLRDEWYPTSYKDFARAYEVAETTALHWQSEAKRHVEDVVPDEQFFAMIEHRLDDIVELAIDSGQLHASVSALKTMLEARRDSNKRAGEAVSRVEALSTDEKARYVLADERLGPAIRRLLGEE